MPGRRHRRTVGGSVTVAAMNQLNFFPTLDLGPDICGPAQTLECRGADTAEEFDRQRVKLLSALSQLDADVIGLNEIENTPGVDPAQNLVDGLNDIFGPGTYATIDTGTIGTDAIKVGIIYRTATVVPVGSHAILDSTRRSTVHRHQEPAGARPDLRGDRHRRPVHGGGQPPQVEGIGLRRRRRPRHRGRLGQLQRHPDAGRRGPGRLAGHRPDGQRRPRLADNRRPQLVRQGGPDRRHPRRRLHRLGGAVPRRARLLVRVRRAGGLSRPCPGERLTGAPGDRGGRVAHQRRRAQPARLRHVLQAARPGCPLRAQCLPVRRPRSGDRRVGPGSGATALRRAGGDHRRRADRRGAQRHQRQRRHLRRWRRRHRQRRQRP